MYRRKKGEMMETPSAELIVTVERVVKEHGGEFQGAPWVKHPTYGFEQWGKIEITRYFSLHISGAAQVYVLDCSLPSRTFGLIEAMHIGRTPSYVPSPSCRH